MPTLHIFPKDPLFFRDGRPFTMGEDTTGGILFPPMPSVFYGALRGLIAAHNGITDGKTAAIQTQNIKINTIDLLSGSAATGSAQTADFSPIFPMPLDIIAFKNDKNTNGLQLVQNGGLGSSMFKNYQLQAGKAEKVVDIDSYRLTRNALKQYLTKTKTVFTKDDENDFINIEKHTITEAKIGHGRDRITSTVAQGKLYRAAMLRTELVDKNEVTKIWSNRQLSFSVNFELADELTAPDSGFMKLGGEAKLSHFIIENETNSSIPAPEFEVNDEYFKIYLATPAIFKDNAQGFSLPTFLDEYADLIACATGKPIYIGGFDMAENKPKTMQRAVSAGSVYYFKTKNKNDINDIVQKFHNTCISDYRVNEGFGRVFFGKINLSFLNK